MLAHPPGPPSGEPAGQHTRCVCCRRQRPKAVSPVVEDGDACVLVRGHGAFSACRWCYLIVKMTPPPHHKHSQALLCRRRTDTAELQSLRGAIQVIHRGGSLAGQQEWQISLRCGNAVYSSHYLNRKENSNIKKRPIPADMVWAQLPLIHLKRVVPFQTVRHSRILDVLRWDFGWLPRYLQICTLNPEVLHY